MNRSIQSLILLFLLLPVNKITGNNSPKTTSIEQHFIDLFVEVHSVRKVYDRRTLDLLEKIQNLQNELRKNRKPKDQIAILVKKEILTEQLNSLSRSEELEINKVSYLKGLQIIKLLYEKTLALDHHFSTIHSLNEINKIGNPNNYSEFNSVKSILASSKMKGPALSKLLGDNLYTSVIHTFVSLFTNKYLNSTKKSDELSRIECILDFTLRMHNDLNTIYFETVFLQKGNETVIGNLEQLFVDYTSPVYYTESLSICRENDDWELVVNKLNDFVATLRIIGEDSSMTREYRRKKIEIQFPIDRLLQFIAQYNTFINQGAKFYEKFQIMLDSYENEAICVDKIPREYSLLKSNIEVAIEKFHTAYKPIEINGSKLKEVLYGINEYQ